MKNVIVCYMKGGATMFVAKYAINSLGRLESHSIKLPASDDDLIALGIPAERINFAKALLPKNNKHNIPPFNSGYSVAV